MTQRQLVDEFESDFQVKKDPPTCQKHAPTCQNRPREHNISVCLFFSPFGVLGGGGFCCVGAHDPKSLGLSVCGSHDGVLATGVQDLAETPDRGLQSVMGKLGF